jgi:hypothetical protein
MTLIEPARTLVGVCGVPEIPKRTVGVLIPDPVKWVPVMLTVVPPGPLLGTRPVSVGAGGAGVTWLDGADGGLEPTSFCATTVKV